MSLAADEPGDEPWDEPWSHGSESRLTVMLAAGFGAGSPGANWRLYGVIFRVSLACSRPPRRHRSRQPRVGFCPPRRLGACRLSTMVVQTSSSAGAVRK